MPDSAPLDPAKFADPDVTLRGEPRAQVALRALRTVWFNTGTLCNITCVHCYIESSPRNDRLAYLRRSEVDTYLDEIAREGMPVEEIGFTGGEPFMNREILGMLEAALERGLRVLVLTNAMKPLQLKRAGVAALARRYGDRFTVRVSLDHYTAAKHDLERGAGTWAKSVDSLVWLARNGVQVDVAARAMWDEDEASMRDGFAALFAAHDLPVQAGSARALVVFPEMDAGRDVPEITTACWGILGKSPDSVMCASSRMVVKRKGAARPTVVACTLIPYDQRFELGETLAEASVPVSLNHPHCARFCVLGGAACS